MHPFNALTEPQLIFNSVSEAYNFTLTSEGAYTIEARNLFYVVDAYNKASTLYANTAGAHITKLFGKLAVARPAVSRRMKYTSCTPSQQLQLVTAASQAQTYANTSSSYVPSANSNQSQSLHLCIGMPQPTLQTLRATPPGSDRTPTISLPTSASSTITPTRRTTMTALALIGARMHTFTPTSD